MSNFTEEQYSYITFNDKIDTKLIATAGSGKTHTIIHKINYMIKNNIYESGEILMLTFSRFTRDDFINRINKYEIKSININCIKTIDSFAKSIIDPNNEVDVSILSYKFMCYLEQNNKNDIQNKLNYVKTIFVDEAQDLNETQYKILCLLKEKNNTIINLIGDPNQNIYQFRGSSDKYLSEFNAKTFYLTYNFRSHQEVVNFSKYLRPNQDVDIVCKKKKINTLPVCVFYDDENDLELNLVKLLKNAERNNINLSDFAILSPTRGRMRSDGKSNGLCLISNIMYKNKFKFKQFYEESTDETTNNIEYAPEDGHINILTYMGSKGLEWKYTIIIDAETCLINKKHFNHEKHKNDQYLLYVACSRAINNLFIFSKYSKKQSNLQFHFNPWFSLIPLEHYRQDDRFKQLFEFESIVEKNNMPDEKKINKLIDSCSEKNLYELALLFDYGVENSVIKKDVEILYEYNNEKNNINMFIGRFIKELFFGYYNIINNSPHKKYQEIENIINLDVMMNNFPPKFLNWYFKNRKNLSWEKYDKEKIEYDEFIVEIIDKNFSRNKELSEYIIFPDCYLKSFILTNVDEIKINYNKYLKCKSQKKIKKYLFKILILIYSLETQHYFHSHSLNGGIKYKYILEKYNDLFDKIYNFALQTEIKLKNNDVIIDKNELLGYIDIIDENNNFYDIKCNSDVSLKNIVSQSICYILYNNIDDDIFDENHKRKYTIPLHFINFLNGKSVNINIILSREKIIKILDILYETKNIS